MISNSSALSRAIFFHSIFTLDTKLGAKERRCLMKKVGKHSTLLDRVSFASYRLKFEFGLILSLGALITIFSVQFVPSETEKVMLTTSQEEVIIQEIIQNTART